MSDYDDEVAADNPTHYWTLEETPSGTLIESGSPTYLTDGPNGGGAVHVDATAYLYVPDYPSTLRPTTAVTAEIWVRTTATNGMFVAAPAGTSGPYGYDLGMFPSNARFETGQGGPSSVTSPGAVNDGTWHHLVGTATSGDRRLYVDGTLAASDTRGGDLAYFIGAMWCVGRRDDGYHLTGDLAAVAVYDTVLSAERIAAHYGAARGASIAVAAVAFTTSSATTFTAAPDPVTAAVSFTTSSATTFTPTAAAVTAAVGFGATAILTVTAEVAVATGAISFRVTGTLDVLARPVGRRRRLVVTDIYGTPYGELENANLGAITFSLNEPEDFSFTLPLSDPKTRLLLDEPMREVMVFRGDQLLAWGPVVRPSADKTNLAAQAKGCLWYLTRRTIGRAARNNYVTNGDFENGLAGWETGALAPMEPLANRSAAYWSAAVTTDRTLTGSHSLRLTQNGPGVPKYGVSASQWFGWSIDPAERPEGDEWTFVARCFIPSDTWIAPPPDGVGIRVSRYSTTRTVAIRRDDGGPEIEYPAPIESAMVTLDENTPRDVWTRLDVALHSPVTGEAEFVQVTLGCPVGTIFWDRAALTVDEGLRFYGVDQSDIVADLVEHLQDPAYGKSDLNLVADSPLTGVLRDRTYLFHEHIVGYDALADFAALDTGFDLSVALTPTTRTIRVDSPGCGGYRPSCALELGRNVADYAWTWDGENAASQVIVLGTGNGSDREEVSVTADAFAGGLTLETVYSAPPDTPIDSLDDLAVETLTATVNPQVLTVTTTAALPGQRDPVGVLWPGDYVPVRIRSGPLQVEGIYRVVELTLNPDDTLELVLNRRVET